MTPEEHFEKALKYVKENLDQELVGDVLETMSEWRVPLSMVDCGIEDDIHDLMEEYGFDNDLAEGWWCEFGDAEDVFERIF